MAAINKLNKFDRAVEKQTKRFDAENKKLREDFTDCMILDSDEGGKINPLFDSSRLTP